MTTDTRAFNNLQTLFEDLRFLFLIFRSDQNLHWDLPTLKGLKVLG